jgi:hypothetical protein
MRKGCKVQEVWYNEDATQREGTPFTITILPPPGANSLCRALGSRRVGVLSRTWLCAISEHKEVNYGW